jgi:hypothetical protein
VIILVRYKSSKQIHKPSIKTVYRTLDRKEPFTETEKVQFSIKEQNLIRGIQLRDKENKQDAIQTYTNYQIEGKRATKALNSSVRKYIKSQYPKHGGKIEHEVSEFEKKKSKSQVKKENKKEVSKFIGNKKNYYKNEKGYNRVKTASKKYPNASVQELRHGVNSKWSQDYRIKHGLNRNYK